MRMMNARLCLLLHARHMCLTRLGGEMFDRIVHGTLEVGGVVAVAFQRDRHRVYVGLANDSSVSRPKECGR
jgi:hypothetical protein